MSRHRANPRRHDSAGRRVCPAHHVSVPPEQVDSRSKPPTRSAPFSSSLISSKLRPAPVPCPVLSAKSRADPNVTCPFGQGETVRRERHGLSVLLDCASVGGAAPRPPAFVALGRQHGREHQGRNRR